MRDTRRCIWRECQDHRRVRRKLLKISWRNFAYSITWRRARPCANNALRAATGPPKHARRDGAEEMDRARGFVGARDANRTVKVAVLKSAEGKLNANQQTLIDTLAARRKGCR